MKDDLWDCVIVGGGPAGLSAAVYMGRFLRRTLVVDDGLGRWSYGQKNDNYLGFPRGVDARRLRALGWAQAERFGVCFLEATVSRVARAGRCFSVFAPGERLNGRTVIWAAGVQDHWPDFRGARRLVGQRLFWCIVCDGWRTLDKKVLLIGRNQSAARTALQFLTYTPRLTFVVEPGPATIRTDARRKLSAQGIRLSPARIREAQAVADGVQVRYDDGRPERFDYVFSLLGSQPRTEALDGLGLRRTRMGHVGTDDKNRTSLPGFFAAGDVTDKHSHQVVSAAHEGAQAAQAANFVLYPPRQRLK
jgi:thioredoxin reductase (NADPH)